MTTTGTPVPGRHSGLFYLVYVSTSKTPFTRAELDRLLERSRVANADRGVTGALLYRDGTFLQVLEGEEATVRALFATICADPRHRDVTYLTDGSTDERQFDRWSMAFGDIDAGARSFAEDYNAFFTERDGTAIDDRHGVARRLLLRFRASLD